MDTSFLFSRKKLRNFLFWVIYFSAMVFVEQSFYSGFRETILTNSGKFAFMIVCYYMLVKVFLPLYENRKYWSLAIIVILFLYVTSVFNIAWRVFYLQEAFPEYYVNSKYEFTGAYINRIDWIFGIYIMYYFRPSFLFVFLDFVKNKRKIVRIEKEKTMLELNALKNQLSPHFLFNTMNNIYTLSLEQDKHTPDLILKLSDILRYIVYQGKDKFVPIESEIEQIQNLIDIESLRHNPEDINISFETDIQAKDSKIAPLLFLSYVENAFKHGLSDKSGDGFVDIYLQADVDNVSFNIKNSVPKDKRNQTQHDEFQIGLKNLKQQLKILYANKYDLNIVEDNQFYEVNLKINV